MSEKHVAASTSKSEPEWPESVEANQREQDAARALKSALVGIVLSPLQIYTTWLLLLVAIDNERLRPQYFWYAVSAAVIALTQVSFIALLVTLNYLI